MTFKHGKFEDSVVMRSLERLEKEKAPVSSQIFKSAAPTLDLTPTPSLVENVLHLCSGLRQSGLSKFADEIEGNFLQFKQAQTLYETSSEKGEDLVDQAHPKGSHKMEDVDSSEAVFHTIVDKHLAALKMVDKKPTGKLSEATSIIKAVRTALGQVDLSSKSVEDLGKMLDSSMNIVRNNVARINQLVDKELTVGIGTYVQIVGKLTSNPTVDNLKELKSKIGKLTSRLDPTGWFHYTTLGAAGLTEDTWASIQGLLGNINKSIDTAMLVRAAMVQKKSEQEVKPEEAAGPPTVDELQKRISGLIAQYSSLSNLLASDDPKDADALAKTKQWLASKATVLQGILDRYNQEGNKAAVADNYKSTIAKYESALARIRQEWA